MSAISHALHFKCSHPYKLILLAIPPFSGSYLIFMAVAEEDVILRLLRHYLQHRLQDTQRWTHEEAALNFQLISALSGILGIIVK